MDTSKVARWLGAAAGLGAGAALTYELLTERYRLATSRATYGIANLPADLDGLRVAHLSDFHAGPATPLWFIRRAVEQANALAPDLIVLTGDYVDEEDSSPDECAGALGELTAPLGVYAVTGNHDYRVGADAVAGALSQTGITVLRNANVALGQGERRLWLAGLEETAGHHEDFLATFEGIPEDDPVVLLSHSPDVLPRAAALGVDLVLAGHTHGGQVCIPGVGAPHAPLRISSKYVAGPNRIGRTRIYVSRGVGMTCLPIRFGCPPEIGLLTLQSVVRG